MSKIFIQELGDSSVEETWKVETDKKYTYLTRNNVDQKIKICDTLSGALIDFLTIVKINEFSNDDITIKEFNIERNFVLLNNTKNMNPLIFEPHGYTENQDLLIITLARGYKLMTYQLSENAEIRSSC